MLMFIYEADVVGIVGVCKVWVRIIITKDDELQCRHWLNPHKVAQTIVTYGNIFTLDYPTILYSTHYPCHNS